MGRKGTGTGAESDTNPYDGWKEYMEFPIRVSMNPHKGNYKG